MSRLISIWLFCLLPILQSVAQKAGFFQGYIITLEGDTISGQVNDRSASVFEELYTKIRLIKDGSKKKKRYGPSDVLGYGYGDTHFVSVGLKEERAFLVTVYMVDDRFPKVFLKVTRRHNHLIQYAQEFVHDDNDFLDEYPLFHKPGTNRMVRVTQGILGLKRQRLIEYFNECPSLTEKIANQEVNSPYEVFNHYVDYCIRQ